MDRGATLKVGRLKLENIRNYYIQKLTNVGGPFELKRKIYVKSII